MSNRSIAIQNSTADVHALGYGRDFALPQTLIADIYAAYITGDVDYNNPLEDITGNGRDLTNNGVAFATSFATFASGQSLECPFTLATLFGVSTGCTLFTISKVPATGLYPLMGNYGGAQSAELFANTGAGYNITNSTAMGQTATDAAGYGLWTARAAVFKSVGGNAYRRRSGSASTFGTAATAHSSTWGTTNVRIGSAYSTAGQTYGHSTALALALTGAEWTQVRLDALYDALVTPVAQLGITL